MRALDLFCGGGGAARGLIAAGFSEVVGVDLVDQRSAYPGPFLASDLCDGLPAGIALTDFDFVWASPPCQPFTRALRGRPLLQARHDDLIGPTRMLLADHPYTCIENIPEAPIRPDLTLTGPQVGLPLLLRKRIFELSFPALSPPPAHAPGRGPDGTLVTVTTSSSVCSRTREAARLRGWVGAPSWIKTGRVPKAIMARAMGLPLSLTCRQIGEAVPPAYAELIGREVLRQLAVAAVVRSRALCA